MTDHTADPFPSDTRLEEVLAEMLQAEEQGQTRDLQPYVERFPSLEAALRDFFHNRDRFAQMAPRLGQPLAATQGEGARGAGVETPNQISTGAERSATALAPGSRFGGYEILEELGRGGMGIVYRARQQVPDREVALKVIRTDRLEPLPAEERAQWIARFHREAQLVASLDQHPNIVTLYEVGEHGGQHYFTMGLVTGGSLAQWIADCRLQIADFRKEEQANSARLIATVARAVDYAHQRGILHRDLKPANILLNAKGEPLVSDFGLARRLDQAGSMPGSGVVGSAPYMPPEQAAGTAGAATTAADVYSLGAILYELLTGQPPFRGKHDFDTLRLVLKGRPVPPRRLNPGLSRDLETICLKCLEKEPARRYHSAEALAMDLDNWLAGRPTDARPVGTLGRLGRWCRREPAMAGAITFAILALVTGAVASGLFGFHWQRAAEDLTEAVAAEKTERTRAETQRTLAVQRADDLRREQRKTKKMAAGLLMDLGVQSNTKGDLPLGMLQLAKALEIADDAEDLADAIRINLAAWRQTALPGRPPLMHPGVVAAVGFSPDGHTLWAISTGTLRMEDRNGRDGKKHKMRVFRPEMIGDPFFEDRIKPLFTAGALLNPSVPRPATPRGRLLLWETATGKPIKVSLPEDLQVLAVSPDLRTVLTAKRQAQFQQWQTTVQVWSLAAGKPVGRPIDLYDCVRFATFSPDGKTALTAGDRFIAIWDPATGKLVQDIGYAHGDLDYLAFSPDAQFLALATGRVTGMARQPQPLQVIGVSKSGSIRLFQRKDGKFVPIPLPYSHQQRSSGTPVAVGPGGRLLVTVSPDRLGAYPEVRLWDRVTGRTVGTLDLADTLSYAAFSPDGKSLLTATRSETMRNGTVQLWETATAKPLGPPLLLRGPVRATVSSPDGKLLLTAGGQGLEGEAQLWNLITARPVGRPFRHQGEVLAVAFSPDGTMMATGSHDGTARLWALQPVQPLRPLMYLAGVVRISADGRRALVRGEGETLRLYDTRTGKPCGKPLRYSAKDRGVVLSPDNCTVLIAHGDKIAQLWNGVTGKAIGKPLTHAGAIVKMGFRAAGKTAFTESKLWAREGLDACFWDPGTGASLGFQKEWVGFIELASSSDGRTILKSPRGRRNCAQVVEAATGKLIGKSMEHLGAVIGGQFSPDGQIVLTIGGRSGSWEEARLWRVGTGQLIGRPLQHSARILTAAFSRNGKLLVTGSEDGTARLWLVDSGKPLGPPLQHAGPVFAAAFSPNGKMIVTGCGDRTARLWHVATGKPLGPPLLHHAAVSFVVFSQDGNALTTGSNDGTSRVWQAPTAMKGTIRQVVLWAQVSTGMELDAQVARLLDEPELEKRFKQLQALGQP